MKQRAFGLKNLIYLPLILFSLLMLYPLFWMLISSLKVNTEIMSSAWSLPQLPQWGNYVQVWLQGRFLQYFANSIGVSAVSILLILGVSSLAAYGFARYDFRFRKPLFYYSLIGQMIPIHATLIPLYTMFRTTGLLDTYGAMILANTAFGLSFAIFLLRAYFLDVPREIEEAARLDGCSEWGIFWRVFLPISKSAMATVLIYQFIWTWNMFLFPLIFVTKESLKTLPLGLMSFNGEWGDVNWSMMFTALNVATLPMIAVLLIFQRQFIKGITAGAVKG